MTRDELLSRLNGFEWNDFECKRDRGGVSEDAYKTVSAFANTAGGWLVFGVSEKEDRLHVSGVEKPDSVQNDFLTVLRSGQKLNRIINVKPKKYEIEGKNIFAFYIPQAERIDKPVYLGGDLRESYIRRGAGDERCTQGEIERFVRDASQERFDSVALSGIPVERCFHLKTVEWYQKRFERHNSGHPEITDPIEFLLNWNFIAEDDDGMRPTRAGVLLFGEGRYVRQILPRPVLDYQRIDTAFERWSVEQRWNDRSVFEENIFQTWQGLVALYMRIAEHPFSLDPATLRRNDDPPDFVAFREAAINMLIHQDYGDHCRKASVRLFTDRTIFWNPGDAFSTVAELLDPTEKELRNPSIVKAFRRIGLSDQAGTGIRTIFRNWHELGRVPPQLQNDKARKEFNLVLLNAPLTTEAMKRFHSVIDVELTQEQADVLALALGREHDERISLTDIRGLGMSTIKQAREVADALIDLRLLQPVGETLFEPPAALREQFSQMLDQSTPQVAPQVLVLLAKVSGEATRQELLVALGLRDRKHFGDTYLQPALEAGLLEMTIPDKPNSRNQRYRLTDLGRAFLRSDGR
ncbi:MAG: putative DNA binding domain-containing protein [Ectothiorhodospiraceae bacterium AqS1]|nr:putative DNA binding domain-containing protein [Ectothiorhodospiraceae bacterium AqS1]